MEPFAVEYGGLITGMLFCFDRILFKGCLPLGWGDSMEGLLAQQGLRVKDFRNFVRKQSPRVAEHAERLAEKSGRPYLYLNGPHRKEAIVQGMIEADGLVAKIPRTRRWRLTNRGTLWITVFLKSHYERYPKLLADLAA